MQSRIDETPKNEKINLMINFDEVTGENTQEHNLRWPKNPNHRYRILIVGGLRSGEMNSLLNLIEDQADFDKIY